MFRGGVLFCSYFFLYSTSQQLELVQKQLAEEVGMDVVASTLRGFVMSISEIIGEVPDRDIIENIFRNFCVGK